MVPSKGRTPAEPGAATSGRRPKDQSTWGAKEASWGVTPHSPRHPMTPSLWAKLYCGATASTRGVAGFRTMELAMHTSGATECLPIAVRRKLGCTHSDQG